MEAVSPRCIVGLLASPHQNVPKMSGERIEARAVDSTAGATSNNSHDVLREDNNSNGNDKIHDEHTPKEGTQQPNPNHDNDSSIHGNMMKNVHPPKSPPIVENHYYVYPHIPQSPAPVSAGYDVQALLMQQHAGRQHYNTVLPPPPLTPPTATTKETMERTNISMGIIPPASPLFATYSMEQQMEARGLTPQSPSPYLAAHPPQAIPTSPGFLYQGYGTAAMSPFGTTTQGDNTHDSNLSPDQKRIAGWNEHSLNQQQPMYQNTPTQSSHLQTHLHYPGISTRGHAASFDEMLPPPTIKEFSESPPAGSNEGATLFSHQHLWSGYNNSGDLYNPSTLSPHHQQRHREMGIHHHAVNSRNFHSFYPPTTPGPPIQMTPHNKGPDGANLFIFHIPNHFTNLDMYHLFCHYGTLLSVRIMVEKDTGRSRGFGFVSYDSPDAAALAIKELNGFVIGNKRLKVQHKQIRTSDQNYHAGGNHESQQGNSHNNSNKVEGQMPIMSDVHNNMAVPSASFANFQGDETLSSSIQSDNKNSVSNTNPLIDVRDESPLSNLDHMKEALPELPK